MCSLNGADPAQCTSPFTADVGVGENVFEVYATHPTFLDRFGEPVEPFYEPIVVTYEWLVVDETPPDTAITYRPREITSSPNAYFGFVSNEGTAEIECSLDFEGFGSCESPAVFEDLLPGRARAARARRRPVRERRSDSGRVPLDGRARRRQHAAREQRRARCCRSTAAPARPSSRSSRSAWPARPGFDELDGGPPITLPGYGGGRFFDLHTTAEYGEPVFLCIPYNPAEYVDGPARLLAFDGSEWTDITLRNDFLHGEVCAELGGLQPDRARARLRGVAARDDLRRARLPLRGRHGDVRLRGGRPRLDAAVLARRPAVHDVRVAACASRTSRRATTSSRFRP